MESTDWGSDSPWLVFVPPLQQDFRIHGPDGFLLYPRSIQREGEKGWGKEKPLVFFFMGMVWKYRLNPIGLNLII